MQDSLAFIVIVLVVILLAALVFFVTRRPERREDDAAADYAAGLNYLVSGDLNLALRKLKDAARKDTNNIDAYIKIGDILRSMGHLDQAIKVHRDLTARSSLTPVQRLQILRALVQDYEARERYDLALQMVQKILAIKKDDLWAKEKELQLLEASGEWEKAADIYKKLSKLKDDFRKSRLALYKVEQGKKVRQAGDEKQSRVHFREAIKIDPKCAAAYLELSDSYLRENRPQEAIRALEKFMAAAPEKADLAFSRAKELLFKIGEFGEIENVYQEVIQRSPENWAAYLALAEIKEKKGELDQAVNLCQQILQKNPDYRPAREYLIRYFHRSGKDQLAVEQALALINTEQNAKLKYRCLRCGHVESEPFWRCPQCHQWETVEGV